MTPQGYDQLLKEFKYLKDKEKPRVNREKQIAAELGDRSENAEYHAAKEKLRYIDKRLKYLNAMIEKAQIINPETLSHERVSFGSTVTLYNLKEECEETFTLCGVLESEVENNLISVHAPLSVAMLGKEVDEMFTLKLPSGEVSYEIVSIRYTPIFSLKKNIRSENDYGYK